MATFDGNGFQLEESEVTFLEGLAGISYVTGDILYYNGLNLTRRAMGNAGQVLTVSGGLPVWADAAAGYTDEQAQDAIGAMIDNSLVYVDATPLLTRAALTGDV